ncbi:MAG TPA: BatA domain-containing protein [Pirellulales bacterium]|nr:BatA domain-containing protein [Pirellulales bacterium]
MTGIGLVNAGFLAATLAVAVPVLIHLLFRRRARVVDIGTLRFLRIVLKDNAHRRKLRRWLLFALRVAGVLLLALLFARPYWSRTGGLDQQRELIVLIDQSASMDARETGLSAFARAQEAASQMLADTAEGTVTHVAYFDAAGVFPIEEVRGVSGGGLRIDDRRRPGFAGTDYPLALAWARDLLAQGRRPCRRLVLLTDLQRSGLGRSGLGRSSLGRARVKDFPDDVEVEVIDVGRPLVRNLAVDEAQVLSRDIRPGRPLVVTARVLNAGAFTVRQARVKLVLTSGGQSYEEQATVSLAAGTREGVRFEIDAQRPGLYQGYVEVEGDDALKSDDRRWLAFEARAVDRVLLVDGEPGVSPYANETYYLETALRLRPPGAESQVERNSFRSAEETNEKRNEFLSAATPYEPERVPADHGENWPDLSPYSVVVLANVAALALDHVSSLAEYVAAGGNLLWFCGGQVRPAAYEPLARVGLLPAEVGKTLEPGVYRFATWDKEHPIFHPLSDPQHGDLRGVSFRRIVELTPAAESQVLAADQEGRPLIIEGRLGKGRVLLAATAADRDWGDWPTNRLYLPLVHQAVGYLSGRLMDGQRVVQRPAGSFDDDPPGVKQDGERVLVRNGDPRESDLERVSAEQLRTELGLPRLVEVVAHADSDRRPPAPEGIQRPDEKWRYMLWGLVVVLVAETFLANRTHA